MSASRTRAAARPGRVPPRRVPPDTAARLVRAQVVLESFDVAADGAVAVVARRVVAGRAYHSHLWAVLLGGGRARQLTHGAVRDTVPRISPDGTTVAFVRAAAPQPGSAASTSAQVWTVPLAGGRPRRATRLPHGVSSLRWSPDGRRWALLGEAGEIPFVVGRVPGGAEPTARHITRTDWRNDEAGLAGRRTHLWVTEARPGAAARQLTAGDFDVANPAWSPDGRWIAFDASLEPDWNVRYRYRIFRVPASGGSIRELVALRGNAHAPSYSPDGRHVAFMGTDVPDPTTPEPHRLFAARASGRDVRCLTPDLDVSVTPGAWADLVLAEDQVAPAWDGADALVVTVGHDGRNVPYRIALSGAAPEALLDPATRLAGSATVPTPAGWVLSAGLDGRASELYTLPRDSAPATVHRLKRLTRLGSAWEDRYRRFELDELAIAGPAGRIQAWMASPRDAGPGPMPTILHFHGGPDGCWAPGGTMDTLNLTARGYRVVMPNIRGSATQGRAWIAALQGQWGVADAEDVHAVADALIELGLTDPHRMGIMGQSYGGWLVQWLVGVTDRFGAAVAENGVGNVLAAWGQSYFGVHFGRMYGQGDPLTPEGAAELWRQSPLRNAAAVRTPLLLLQAAEDRNCPPGPNEELFVALKALGRTTEYVLYPEEHHELKNSGRPDRRADRMQRHLAWFDRYLGSPRAS